MNESIRGIECSIEETNLKDLLRFLSKKADAFLVSWCMIYPDFFQGDMREVPITSQNLLELSERDIWELDIQVYPTNVSQYPVNSYEDFLHSECSCCLLYYDCGVLEIYIKDPVDFQQIWDLLVLLHAKDMVVKTDSNDGRVLLHI